MIALYRVLLGGLVTRGRVIGLGALGLLAVLLGAAIGAQSPDPAGDGLGLVNLYGLSLFVPVTTLVFASAALGEPNEDGTLVYLWLRPVPRWQLAVAAIGASLTVAGPLVIVPMTLAAAAADTSLVGPTLASCALAVVAYAALFTWLGLRVRRALVWGLAYILVWEGFVARAGATPARLAVRAHSRTLLARLADGDEDLIEVSMATAIAFPLLAVVVATALAVRRLTLQDVA